MHLLIEEAGKFHVGRLLTKTDTSSQVELDSGRRLKVKATNILLSIETTDPVAWLAQARHVGTEVDIPVAWEFAPEEDFDFGELAREYFSAHPSPLEQAGMLFALHGAPHYFRRAGRGRFRKASAQTVALALAAIEKKKQVAQQIRAWSDALCNAECPAPIREQLHKILFKPDKTSAPYQAVVDASRRAQCAPLDLLVRAGAIDSAYQFHWKRFLLEHFPQGTAFPRIDLSTLPNSWEELPLSPVRALSIDDSSTTEIDDALSVQGLGEDIVTVGIHIAIPGLGIEPGDAIDALCRARLSTVYVPGHKVTMLPDAVVERFTLQEGRNCPALSLYLRVRADSLDIVERSTRIEQVHIEANLRHDRLDGIVTPEWLDGRTQVGTTDGMDRVDSVDGGAGAEGVERYRSALSLLYRLAQRLHADREAVRGKPESLGHPDYNFRLMRADAHSDAEPDGSEWVEIGVRRRGAPLDLIVSEAMIVANSTWGAWLAELGVAGIYRGQPALAPGVKVRMSTKPQIHAGMGVRDYAWSSSPLRRYVDLVNQWQLIACVRHGTTARLAAPFPARDTRLFAILSDFDATYSAYRDVQNALERFWTLRYLQQRGVAELEALVLREGLVRALELPLVLTLVQAPVLERGDRVRVRLDKIDEVSLEVRAIYVSTLDDDAQDLENLADDEDEALPTAITIDVDLADAPEDAGTTDTTDNTVATEDGTLPT
ncbi:ribonuclease catalytic domain-containing protein [Candidatus Symbiobacter mobilis]|uniref:Exoribonuclease II n=1 Tax=Candidatus Symbiobacter mobilis CR TaxID=946483 RepID=U5N8D9_9BURK|nr:RNB domain-containing ribonuclease [Candidatus Symbiobacter mobilis]AGX87667.1 exoribonuclease II [Candidatus Symbiobacter mobilis CR]